MSDRSIAEARALISAQRYQDAAAALVRASAYDGSDPEAAYLLCVCWLELDRDAEALQLARALVSEHADFALAHFVLARAELANGQAKLALASAERAVALDPADPDAHALRGLVLVELRRAPDALAAAEHALALDADSAFAAKVRTLALQGQGRFAEADREVAGLLRADPQDPIAWRLLGASQLRSGKPRDALVSFGEALRIDPRDEASRVGLAEALKARSLPYRWFVQLSDWIERGGRVRAIAFFIAIYVGPRVLRALGKVDPRFLWLAVPFGIAAGLIVMGSWLLSPLHDLLLIGNPKVRHVLRRNGWIEALFLGAALFAAVVGGLGLWLDPPIGKQPAWLFLVLSPFLIVALRTGLEAPRGWRRALAVPLAALSGGAFVYGTAWSFASAAGSPEREHAFTVWIGGMLLNAVLSWLRLLFLGSRRA
jgi:tetratricopeptide (TPR) repeat protein